MSEKKKIIFPTLDSFLKLAEDEARLEDKYKSIFCPKYDINNRLVYIPEYYLHEYKTRSNKNIGKSDSVIERKLHSKSIILINQVNMEKALDGLMLKNKDSYTKILDGAWCSAKEWLSLNLTLQYAKTIYGEKSHYRFALTETFAEYKTSKIHTINSQIANGSPLKKYQAF